MDKIKLKEILEKHLHWWKEDCDGWEDMRADLSRADLLGANLIGADLSRADLSRADLSRANLLGANITEDLIDRFFPMCCPECGSFIAWKKANGHIVKLQIPDDAKRGSAFGRKCRADKAVCLAIENMDGTPSEKTEIASDHDSSFIYRVGEMVSVDDFDDDRIHECAPGIHFFITRREAVEY